MPLMGDGRIVIARRSPFSPRARMSPHFARFLNPFGGYRACPSSRIVRVHSMNPTHASHNMPGRFWVGFLIGLVIVALAFALT